MATNETPAITSPRLWTRLANWNASLITIRLPFDRRESTKAVGDMDLTRSIENRLRGERVRQQCMAVSEMWEIFNQLAVAAGAAMIMGLYVLHQSEDAVSSKVESGQSPRWRPWLALALENVTSRAFPAETESEELQSNLLVKICPSAIRTRG